MPESATEELKKRIPLSRLVGDNSTQVRGAVSSTRVTDYAFIIAEQGDMDPIAVFYEGEISSETKFWVGDGFHRIAAYKAAGKDKVPAILYVGTKSDAIEFGLRKNGHHGAPMTSKEKRAAADIAVKDPKIGAYSDSKIANLIGTSTSLVNQVRRGITPEIAERRSRKTRTSVASEETWPTGKPASAAISEESTDAAPVPENSVTVLPSAEKIVNQVQNWLKTGAVSVPDIARCLSDDRGAYVHLPYTDAGMTLKVVGITGRVQVDIPCSLKEIDYENIVVRYTAGRLVDSSAEVK